MSNTAQKKEVKDESLNVRNYADRHARWVGLKKALAVCALVTLRKYESEVKSVNDKKRAWIYTRVKQAADSHCLLETQREKLISHAADMGYWVEGISFDYADGITLNRSGLTEVTEAARHGKFDVLFVPNFNHLWRDAEQLAVYLCQFQALGLDVYSSKEGSAHEHEIFGIYDKMHHVVME